jgi:hypothetical protein
MAPKTFNIKKIDTGYIFYIAFLITIIIGVYFRMIVLDYAFVNEWVTRDFDRAFNIFDGSYIPLAGPEYDNGGRLPGPFLYFLLLIPILIDYSYDSIIIFNFALNLASLILFFWVVKRFFDQYVAILSSIFLLIYLPFVQVAGFPINPAFIFPFIAIFIWLLLEITLNQNYKYLPLVLLVLSLAIQLHFSVSTFYAVLLVNLVLFKAKIPWRFIWISLLVLALCFTPYFIYKNSYYMSSQVWVFQGTNTIKGISEWSLSEILKIVFLKKTILRMTYFNGLSFWVPFSNNAVAIYFFLIYSTLLIYVLNIFKKGIQNCKKEIIVFSCFFIPALIFEIIHPKFNHNWYSYIFILPLFLIISIAITNLYKSINKVGKASLATGLTLLICILISDAFTHLEKYKKAVFMNSYKNSQKIFELSMQNLNLSPKEFVQRVYFDSPILPYSLKRLELSDKNPIRKPLEKSNTSKCYYLIDPKYKNVKKKSLFQERMDSFSTNKDLQSVKLQKERISFIEIGWLKMMEVYEYIPKDNNTCYQNLLNPFQVTKDKRDLLVIAKKIQKNDPIVVKSLQQEWKFDSNSNLTLWEGNHVVVNNLIKLPIHIKVLIKKAQESYLVTAEIDGYGYNGENPTKEIGFIISSETSSKTKKATKFKMNFNKLFENSVYSTNFSWKQDFYLPENTILRKNEFDISLFWEIENSKNDPKIYSVNSLQTIQVSLTNDAKEEKQAPFKNQGYWRKFKNLLDYLI